jgi:hypothetical protein
MFLGTFNLFDTIDSVWRGGYMYCFSYGFAFQYFCFVRPFMENVPMGVVRMESAEHLTCVSVIEIGWRMIVLKVSPLGFIIVFFVSVLSFYFAYK